MAQAASAIPVKFALGGNRGLGIFAAGYPKAKQVPCEADDPFDVIESISSAGQSGLQFGDGQYVYVWKTEKSWSGTARLLTVTLADGTKHLARFTFTK